MRKRQRSQLESQEEVSDDLRAQNDMKNTLLHAVSHDLKGPLAGILGAMQTIRRADQLKLTGVELNGSLRRDRTGRQEGVATGRRPPRPRPAPPRPAPAGA